MAPETASQQNPNETTPSLEQAFQGSESSSRPLPRFPAASRLAPLILFGSTQDPSGLGLAWVSPGLGWVQAGPGFFSSSFVSVVFFWFVFASFFFSYFFFLGGCLGFRLGFQAGESRPSSGGFSRARTNPPSASSA